MVELKQKKVEFHEGNQKEIIIKQIVIDESKSSMKMMYRRDKEGNIICTGFDVKAYGDGTTRIKSKNDSLIRTGIERMNNPMMKGDEIK